ncbi:MAG TPA: tetratricopeptide repeat protein [Candidatus Manganitrophaceae bacterium]|nr:tetratricopeptide repeat protein [Candidatus Manganitrophaceae bacterium]
MKRQYFYGILLWMLLLAAAPRLSAEEIDSFGRLSEGVRLLTENDLGGAMRQFEQALAGNGRPVEAHYYLGIAETRAGRAEEAERHFQQALSIDRTFVPAHFDLAVLYYRTGRNDLALKSFETVEKVDPGRAKVHYYRGAILQRQGKRDEAAAEWEKAVLLDPRLALEVHYETGVASYNGGDLEAARRAFQNVMTISPESEAAQSAGGFLEKIDEEGAKRKRWDVSLSLGAQYDDNVILEPNQSPPTAQTITDKSDLVGVVFLRGRYQWLHLSDWSGRVEYSFYQNFHRDDALENFNIQSHQLIFNGGRRIGQSELLLQYELQYALLGGDSFMLKQTIGPRFILPESKRNLTEFSYQFGAKRFDDIAGLFPNNSERNVQLHKAGFTHYYTFESKGNLHGGYAFDREIAGSLPNEDDWTFSGHRFYAGLVLPPWRHLILAADAEYILRRFDHENQQPPNEKRNDHELLAIVTLTRSFGERLDLSLQYLHQQNRSNIPLFEYDRNIYGVVATIKF